MWTFVNTNEGLAQGKDLPHCLYWVLTLYQKGSGGRIVARNWKQVSMLVARALQYRMHNRTVLLTRPWSKVMPDYSACFRLLVTAEAYVTKVTNQLA